MVSSPVPKKAVTLANMNRNLRRAEYAVRGRLAIRADELRKTLLEHEQCPPPPAQALPFTEIISANIGNPQAMDQQPITFFRQVLALVQYPDLLKSEHAAQIFPADARKRAQTLLDHIGSVGAYSHSQGVPYIRQSVANFIARRDGFPSNPKDVFLASGASSAVSSLLRTICDGPDSAVMIPVPQYPLYSATLTLENATAVPYYLEYSAHDIANTVRQAKASGLSLRSIVVINPCNPTGTCLTEAEIKDIITIAADNRLMIIADEVYQTNIYEGEFLSFKRMLRELQRDYPGRYENVELASLHSTSKGMLGECGQRGGYVELVGFDPAVVDQMYKLVSISLCPVVTGQVLTELMVNPPREGDESFPLYKKEYNDIYNSLKKRAFDLYQAFSQMEGVICEEPKGAMYLFPQITIPKAAIQEAARQNMEPDEFYCIQLLEKTGVCVIPGSGFGQQDGTFHFRTTFLAPGHEYIDRMVNFHSQFMDKYR
ncbi:pyridoxal phosphate-dependent transferase [Myxozyma melibiosi]|uniref:Pyridoxal phosphate-dependent transferase n=1 Tax=Myxozyma melibiosi TaxID=54550 RepID=A0ABR1FBS0_9ASCO